MYPELLPHPRHERAIELMREYETALTHRWGQGAFVLDGYWLRSPEHIEQFLLMVCNQTRDATDDEFERAVVGLLANCSRLPLYTGPAPAQR